MRGDIRRFIQSDELERICYWGGNNQVHLDSDIHHRTSRMYKLHMIKEDLTKSPEFSNNYLIDSKGMKGYYKLTVNYYMYDGDLTDILVWSGSVRYLLDHISEHSTTQISFADIIANELQIRWKNEFDYLKVVEKINRDSIIEAERFFKSVYDNREIEKTQSDVIMGVGFTNKDIQDKYEKIVKEQALRGTLPKIEFSSLTDETYYNGK